MGRNGKKGANQHNAKHENGVVAPGKRVTKQKSNSHLANGSTDISKETDNKHIPVPLPTSQSSTSGQDVSDIATGFKSRSIPAPRPVYQIHTDSASDDLEESDTMPSKAIEQNLPNHRRIDVTTAKQSTTHDGGTLQVAMTVLKACPIRDSLAILVVLLSLPPTMLSLTNGLFALLTFVPPAGTFTSLPSLSDITSSFSPGSPSFLVLLLIDFIAICVWSIMPWPSIQTVLLDCAQATVATWIGGALNLRPGSADNFPLVITFVFVTHVGRYRRTLLKLLHRTSLARYLPLIDSLDDLPVKPSYNLHSDRSSWDTVRIWIALHILLQGLTVVVRKALHTPGESSLVARSADPEVNNSFASFDNFEPSTPSSPSAIKSKASLQNLREVRDKISTGKRRRRQATQVRQQQPLWAAIAQLKSKVVREWEQKQATNDALGAHSSGLDDLGSAPFSTEENKIWITTILTDRFYFETGPIRGSELHNAKENDNEVGVDHSPPFVVCVNGATWASTKVLPVQASEDTDGRTRWIGEIYGLSAANTYRVSFVGRKNDTELYSEIIVTPNLPTIEQALSSSTIPTHALRPASPASPIATVKTSIAAFEASINELIATQKRARKDNKAMKVRLEKEIEGLTEKLSRVVASTKTIAQKHTQLENIIKQTEDAIVSLTAQINDHGSIPEDDINDWQEHKNKWEKIRNELSRVQEDVQRAKEESRTDLATTQSKELSERQKRDRARTRVKKLTTDHTNLQHPAKNSDHHRANSSYANRAAELDHVEAEAKFQYDAMRTSNQDIVRNTQAIKNEIDYMEHISYQNDVHISNQSQARFAHDSRPITPEGDLPGTNPQAPGSNQSATFPRPHLFNTPELHHAVPAGAGKAFTNGLASSSRHNNVSARHRSQSALSGNSVYAVPDNEDDEDEDPIPVMHKRRAGTGITGVREGSDGRSSGSGSPHVTVGPAQPPAPIGSERRNSPAQAAASGAS